MSDYEHQYASSFDWRRDRNIQNLAELAELRGASPDPINPEFIEILWSQCHDDRVVSSLFRSITYLSCEAIQTYITGFFQASILSTGAVLERILKVEYRIAKGDLPEGKWTLGKCAYDLDWGETRVTEKVLRPIKEFKGTRDSRTHALLEHENPSKAMIGGDRGIEKLPSGHYHIEPFRGEALAGMRCLFTVGSILYSGIEKSKP